MEVISTTPTNKLGKLNNFDSFSKILAVKNFENLSDFTSCVQINAVSRVIGGNSDEEHKTKAIEFWEDLSATSKDLNIDSGLGLLNKPDFWRTDIIFKSSLRLVRNKLRSLFKSQNKSIVKLRYVNCRTKKIFKHMKETLSQVLPQELISDSLIYYWIGILKLKDFKRISCPDSVKQEIQKFLWWVSKFTKTKFHLVMDSEYYKVLCGHMIDLLPTDDRSKLLKEFLR